MTASSHADVQGDSEIDGIDFDPVAAFFENLEPDAKASKAKREEEAPEATEEAVEADEAADADETTEEAEEGSEDPAKPADKATSAVDRRQAADDDEVVVQIGDEAKRVSVKDLKRLFGQEASLTQKSQQVAEARKAIEAEQARYGDGLGKMAKEAGDRWAEYQKIDYLTAKDAMDAPAFAKLREDAQRAFQLNEFYAQEASAYTTQAQQARTTALQGAAKEAVKVLNDPAAKAHIPNWSDTVYNELRSFAIDELGAPPAVVNQLVDPWALKVIHMALQQSKAAKDVAALVGKPRPVVKAAPAKNLTTKESPVSASTEKGGRRATALARLSNSGDVDDAANAFLAGWEIE